MLYADLETFSELDIKATSLDQYANHPSTRILMCAYAGETGPVELWEESDGKGPLVQLIARMRKETCVAWNVGFENNLTRAVWHVRFKWIDAMVYSLYAGLPAGLKSAVKTPFFADAEEATSKETVLINKFCKPSKSGEPHNRDTDPEDWAAFCDYCKRDVYSTRAILQWIMARYDFPPRELRAWQIDQRINERGMPMDRKTTERAWAEAQRLQVREYERLKELTGLDNPNSPAQLLAWLKERDYPYGGLSKELVLKALKEEPDGETDEDE
ncbi:MAG TPA: hypothetical protein VFB43_17780 [Terracidiphilus sp.]|nr:hypothetical protein [Terracidiphilus sp.]